MSDQHPDQHPTPAATEPAEVVDPGGEGEAGFDLSALFGGGGEGAPDLGGLLQAAQAMQQGLVEAQARAAEQEVEGVAGGGAVKIRATAGLEPISVTIAKDAVDPDDVEGLEDLVLAALRDLIAQANEVHAQVLGGFGGLEGLTG